MDIIMPVAGFGTRLRPQTWSKPKPLVPIAGRPILAHVIDRVITLEPERLIFVTGYLGEKIEQWVTENYDIPALFIEQSEMRGQTDAIIRARTVARGEALILFPDMIFEADFSAIGSSDADTILFTKVVDDPSALGIAVEVEGQVSMLIEKPAQPVSNLAVIGIYYFRQMQDLYSAIEEQMKRGIALRNEYFLADAIQIMIDRGHKVVTAPVAEWEDCGSDEALLNTNRFLLQRTFETACSLKGSVVNPPSYIDSTATIASSVIGPYASIGPNAIVKDSIIRDSILDEGAEVIRAQLDRSIVGRAARLRGRSASVNVGDSSTLDL